MFINSLFSTVISVQFKLVQFNSVVPNHKKKCLKELCTIRQTPKIKQPHMNNHFAIVGKSIETGLNTDYGTEKTKIWCCSGV